jgi:hypothetical protein
MFKPPNRINEMLNKQYNAVDEVNSKVANIWLDHIVFSTGWWVSVALCVLPWVIWFCFRKKDSSIRLLTGGFWVMFIATFLNYLGVTLGLWRYNVKTIPAIPDFIAWDFSLMPVTIMFFIQIKPDKNPIIKGLMFAAMTAFLAEPLFKWLGFFDYPGWHFWASFPFYFVIYLIAHYLVNGDTFHPLS